MAAVAANQTQQQQYAQYAQLAAQFVNPPPAKKDDGNGILSEMGPMKALKHGGLLVGNLIISILILMFISVFIFVAAILTSVLAGRLGNNLKNYSLKAPYGVAITLTVILWIGFSVMGLVTLAGFWLIPWIFGAVPYIGSALFVLFGIFNVIIAILLFYIAISIHGSDIYKGPPTAKAAGGDTPALLTAAVERASLAYKLAIGSGIFIMIVALMLIIYGVIIIIMYKRMGGLKSTLGVAINVAGVAAL